MENHGIFRRNDTKRAANRSGVGVAGSPYRFHDGRIVLAKRIGKTRDCAAKMLLQGITSFPNITESIFDWDTGEMRMSCSMVCDGKPLINLD